MHPGGVLAIVNPASSSGRTLRRVPALQRALASRIPEIQIRSTEGPGHATLLARRALEAGARLVVSVGGDGTNSEVLAGFVDGQGRNRFPDAELGLLHAGTGGDFLRHLGRRSADQAIDALAAGAATSVDYGVATYVDDDGRTAVRPFLNVASAGVSGLVDYHVRRSNRWLGPTATYLLGSVRGIVEFRAKPVAIAIDGGAPVELSMALGVVANGQYFGGGMWVAPRGRCDDGVFEILHTPGGSRAGLLSLLAQVFRGRHVDAATVTSTRGRVVEMRPLDPDDVVLLDLDGEQPGRLPARFHIEAGALRLRAAGLPGPARTLGARG
ncbi:MAG: diacylglycerol kinase family lipid kinase [Myxococcales bacterium]|nr:diacylglycerol kinase family lipid kinase [Myxococcales bacterium]